MSLQSALSPDEWAAIERGKVLADNIALARTRIRANGVRLIDLAGFAAFAAAWQAEFLSITEEARRMGLDLEGWAP